MLDMSKLVRRWTVANDR